MITPGRDDNYPTSSGNFAAQYQMNGGVGAYAPHIGIGFLAIVLFVLLLYFTFGSGGRRRRR